MSNAKFANALVQNLSILDGTGFDRRGYYAEQLLSILARDGELIALVCEYNLEIRRVISRESLVRPEPVMKANHPYMRAKRLVRLTNDWIEGINRDATEEEIISFLST